MKKIIKGAVFYADLDSIIKSEHKTLRPVVVIQNDLVNKQGTTVIVAPISESKEEKHPTHIPLKQFKQIRPNSVIMLEEITTVIKANLKGFVDFLLKEQLNEIDQTLIELFDIKKL